MTQLTPAQQSFADAQVAAGAFQSPAEVVEAAFHLLQSRQSEYAALTGAIAEVTRGEVAELNLADIKSRGRERMRGG